MRGGVGKEYDKTFHRWDGRKRERLFLWNFTQLVNKNDRNCALKINILPRNRPFLARRLGRGGRNPQTPPLYVCKGGAETVLLSNGKIKPENVFLFKVYKASSKKRNKLEICSPFPVDCAPFFYFNVSFLCPWNFRVTDFSFYDYLQSKQWNGLVETMDGGRPFAGINHLT